MRDWPARKAARKLVEGEGHQDVIHFTPTQFNSQRHPSRFAESEALIETPRWRVLGIHPECGAYGAFAFGRVQCRFQQHAACAATARVINAGSLDRLGVCAAEALGPRRYVFVFNLCKQNIGRRELRAAW